MTDGYPGGATAPGERLPTTGEYPPATEERQPWRRPAVVAAFLAGLLLLATIGSVSGWLLAGGAGGDEEPEAGSGPTVKATTSGPSAPTAAPPRPPAPSPTRPPGPSLPPPQNGQFALPDLVGMDFKEARTELRRRGLGWQLTFGAAGDDPSIASTEPRAGTTVRRGTTVRISVVGAAPEAIVPDVTGLPCARGAASLIDLGLYPEYPTGRTGEVVRQDPAPSTVLRWNDRVTLHCGSAGDGESAAPDSAD